jgi:ABC-type transport system involved in multi-copper enzyme maturation permease subunit
MSPTQAVLWKEWTEHRWKMAFGTVMLACFAGALFAWGGISDHEAILLLLFAGCLMFSILNAMDTFAQEHSEGTTLFLVTRPFETWKVFLGKWMVGWINTLVPLLACGLTLGVWFGSSPQSGSVLRYMVPGTLVVAWIATMLYSLTCCVTLRRGGPAAVGLGGLLWAGAMILHLVLSEVVSHPVSSTPSLFGTLVFFVNPIGIFALVESHPSFRNAPWLLIAVGIAEQGILFAVILWIGLRSWKRSI